MKKLGSLVSRMFASPSNNLTAEESELSAIHREWDSLRNAASSQGLRDDIDAAYRRAGY